MLGFSAALTVAALTTAAPTPMRLPADVEDVYALRANPGGLAYLEGAELRLLYARADGPSTGPTDGFALYGGLGAVGPLSFAMSLDVDVDDQDRTGYTFAFGSALRLGGFGLGWSVDRFRAPGAEGRTRLHAGLAHRWTSWLATGLDIRDVTQSAARRQWDLGLAVRPHDRVVISARWRLVQDREVFDADNLDLAGLVTVEPLDGLRLGVGVQHDPIYDFALSAQLEIGFGRVSIGGAALAVNADPSVVSELAFSARGRPPIFTGSSVAVVDIGGAFQPEPRLNLLRRSLSVTPYGNLPLLLERLATEDGVQGVFVRIGPVSAGWGRLAEIRAGLRRIRGAGRRVDCLLGGTTDAAYYVATGCDQIIVAPPSLLRVDGIAATSLFFGDALDRIGVQAEVSRQGKYKSAPEQLSRSGMSPAQREALSAYLDDVYATLVEGISEGRALKAEAVRATLDLGTHTASQAKARGLVDAVLYPDEVEAHLHETYGRKVSFKPAGAVLAASRPRWSGRDRVALVYVDAAIAGGESEDLPFGLGQSVGARTLVGTLERLRVDPGVRAVVLRVDSPGGDSLASDLIARAVKRLAAEKPVIASFGDVAASGGYYVAAPARAIYASPATLTGSIGVFSVALNAQRLAAKLGIGVERVRRGARAGAGSPFIARTEDERAQVDRVVEHYYEQFLSVVAEGRKMSRDEVHAVAQGRIWSGRAAKAAGLVDELGGLLVAIDRAKQEAGLAPDDPVELAVYPRNRRPLARPLRTLASWAGLEAPAALDGLVGRLLPAAWVRRLGPWLGAGPAPQALALLVVALDID